MSGEYSETNAGNTELIVSFGGMGSKMGSLGTPFEFVRSLRSMKPNTDRYFYVDHDQCHYHNGITGIADSIPKITKHLRKLISKYSKVTFIGCSAGGYAAILFGSILNVDEVIAFKPQTFLRKTSPWNDLRKFINHTTDYVLFACESVEAAESFLHNPRHCDRLSKLKFSNIKVIKRGNLDMRQIRDDGTLEKLLE